MNDKIATETIKILKKVGAIITDTHVVLTNGRHSDTYINKDKLYTHIPETSRICEYFAEASKDLEVDVVAGPAIGGIILAQWTAYHLSNMKKQDIHAVYTEKTPEKDQIFTRGYDKVVQGKNVLVVEDLTTTGLSAKKVVDSVKKAGGNVLAAIVMVNRQKERVTSDVLGVPFLSLATLDTKDYEESECPWCKEERPINIEVGHGKHFLAHKNK